jgi:hypothetical protein
MTGTEAQQRLTTKTELSCGVGDVGNAVLNVERSYPLSGSPVVGWWDVPVPAYQTEQRAWYEQERAGEQ